MPYRLKMSKIQSVLALREKGWTYSRIARELGVHRETVARYVQRQETPSIAAPEVSEAKPAEAPPGSDDPKPTEAPRRTAKRNDCRNRIRRGWPSRGSEVISLRGWIARIEGAGRRTATGRESVGR